MDSDLKYVYFIEQWNIVRPNHKIHNVNDGL